ncbi:MAG: YciI family protein [Panacagrimonas sp.]
MKYAIVIYETADDFAARNSAKAPEYWAPWKAYAAALGDTLTGGACLQGPGTATTLSLRDGKRQVQDGPYAETKEQLGGVMLIEAANLDAALEWAARCPAAASGKVEVRPIVPMSG